MGAMNSRLRGRRILVVEDEDMLAQCLSETLQDNGAVVVGPAGRLADAMTLVDADHALEAVILDVNLAGESAYPLADRLIDRGVPLLLTSGYDRSSTPARYADVAYCTKPFGTAQVVQALASLLPA